MVTISKLVALVLHTILSMLMSGREAVNINFSSHLVCLDEKIKPRSTDCEADVLITTLTHQSYNHHSNTKKQC